MKHVEYNIFRWSIRENIKILFLAKQLRPHQFNFLFIRTSDDKKYEQASD